MTDFRPLEIADIVEIVPPRNGDDRGFFSEVYKRSAFEDAGIHIEWIQDNQSLSASPGTVRGLHFQIPPMQQDKLVRVIRGAIFDVAVDLRNGSPSFGKWVGRELSAERWNQLLIPSGFAHGFMTLTPDTEVLYKVSGPWSREHERVILWNDPAIGIGWPDLGIEPTLVERDRQAPRLADFESPFHIEAGPCEPFS